MRLTEERGCKLSDKLGETGKGALKMSMMAGRVMVAFLIKKVHLFNTKLKVPFRRGG